MCQLGKTIVSEDILEKDFVCNLSACHGACCVDGDAGSPLSEEETKILEEIYPKVKPFLRKEGIEAIERLGAWVKGTEQDLSLIHISQHAPWHAERLQTKSFSRISSETIVFPN